MNSAPDKRYLTSYDSTSIWSSCIPPLLHPLLLFILLFSWLLGRVIRPGYTVDPRLVAKKKLYVFSSPERPAKNGGMTCLWKTFDKNDYITGYTQSYATMLEQLWQDFFAKTQEEQEEVLRISKADFGARRKRRMVAATAASTTPPPPVLHPKKLQFGHV